jgi:hypothetical protein
MKSYQELDPRVVEFRIPESVLDQVVANHEAGLSGDGKRAKYSDEVRKDAVTQFCDQVAAMVNYGGVISWEQ